ncbi:siderophore iron transporter mirA [Fusarium coicis]|nr:siderophore iron transporter mirA [Fusarium coicis]
MAAEKSEITPAGQGPLDQRNSSATIDSKSNQDAISAPTEALRKLWTKFPLILAFFGIGGALWNTLLPRRLAANLPEEVKANSTAIFRSIVVAQSYELGTETRDAINLSYRMTQQTLAIGSLSLSIPLLLMMFFFRNIKLAKEDNERNEIAEQQLAAAGQNVENGRNETSEKK